MVKCTPRVLFYVSTDLLGSSTEKNTQQFQALNGLKCSTVGNLGSQWAFVIILLGFPHFFGAQSQQEAQLMLTTGSTRYAVSQGQQTWYHSTCYI